MDLLPENETWEEYFEHSLLHDPLPVHEGVVGFVSALDQQTEGQ